MILNNRSKFRPVAHKGAFYTNNRDFPPTSRFISEMIRDGAIVIVECQYEVVCDLTNGVISNGPERPIAEFSRSQYSSASNYSKMTQDRATVSMADE